MMIAVDVPSGEPRPPGRAGELASMPRVEMAPAFINSLAGSSSSQRTRLAWKRAAFSRAARSR